jgi:O-antigen/teichoic acid export membrane protein
MINTWKKNIQIDFVKSLSTLLVGSGTVQALSFFMFPILAKIYSPEEFGVFAVFLSISSVVSSVITGRYELAIAIPSKDSDAANITGLSIFLSAIISILLPIIFLLFNKKINYYTNNILFTNFFYVMPFYFFIISFYRIMDYWSFRNEYYKKISIYRIFEKLFILFFQLFFPFVFFIQYKSIIFGEIVGKTFSCLLVIYLLKDSLRKHIFSVSWKNIVLLSKEYINFPKFYVPSYFLTTFTVQVPVFMIEIFFGNKIVGFFSLTERFLRAPCILLGANIHDLFRQKLASKDKNVFHSTFMGTLKLLFFIGLLIFIPLYFIMPIVFKFLFGEKWLDSGIYAQIMIPMIFIQFISTSVSPVLLILKKQKTQFIIELISSILTFLSFFMSMYIKDIKNILMLFSVVMSIFHLMSLLFYYHISKKIINDYS